MQPVCVTCQNAGQTWPKMMFGKESICDYSESAISSCERVNSSTKAITVWCLIFITGCYQLNTELLLLLCHSRSSVFLDPPSTHLAAQPAQGQGLVPAGLVSLRAHCWCPLQQQGTSWGSRAELALLAAHWTLSKPAGKLHSSRYLCLCKDEVLIISAWDALSVSPLENVLLC